MLQKELDDRRHIDPLQKEVMYNPKYEEMFAPVLGPEKLQTSFHNVNRNTLAGHVEPAHINDFDFESQRRTFTTYGKCLVCFTGLVHKNATVVVDSSGKIFIRLNSSCPLF